MTFLLMSDSEVDCHCHSDSFLGCGCVWRGGRVGTVYAALDSESAANDALAEVDRRKAAQRKALDEWGQRSWAENPVRYDAAIKDKMLRGMRAVGDRDGRRADWMKEHPLPPMDLQHEFWVVEIAPEQAS